MTENEKKIIQLLEQVSELRQALDDCIAAGQATQQAYNILVLYSRVPPHVNKKLHSLRERSAVHTRKVNEYVDKVNEDTAYRIVKQ